MANPVEEGLMDSLSHHELFIILKELLNTLNGTFLNLTSGGNAYLGGEGFHSTSASSNPATMFYDSMRNLTLMNMLGSEIGNTYFSSETNHEELLMDLCLQMSSLAQYFASFVLTLVGAWSLNKHTVRSEIITDVLETVISILMILPALPAIFLFFLGILGARLLVHMIIQVKYGLDKFSLLNPVDGFWAYEETASTSCCVGLYIIEGDCDPKVIRKKVKDTVESDLVGGKMSRKMTTFLGFACWETIPKGEMDMEEYIKVVEKWDWNPVGEEEVFEVMRDIQDKTIETRAPWEVYVVPNFTYEKKNISDSHIPTHYAVIYRIGHTIMDGISTANVLHSAMADKPFKFSLDPTEPPASMKLNMWKTAILFFLGFVSMPRVALRNLFLVDNFHNKYCLPGPLLTGPKTFLWTRPIRVGALKEIKNKTKTTVYSVLLSSLGGAFREYLSSRGVHLECENFHAMSPIALLPYPDRKPRNRFTGVIVPTSIAEKNKYLTPVERVQKNYKGLKELGSSSATFLAIANWYYPVVLGLMPLFLHKPLSVLPHLRLSLSNVPGPAEDVYIYGGGKIVDVGIWLPIKYSMGFGMGLLSYKDRVRATVVGDKAYYPKESDVKEITEAFEKELTELGHSVGIQDVFVD